MYTTVWWCLILYIYIKQGCTKDNKSLVFGSLVALTEKIEELLTATINA